MYSCVIMGRPKKNEPKRERLSITIHPDLNKWIQENSGSVVENKPFRSASDLVENAVILLKEKLESKK
jgi:Arc/MetJ-type ribon-helix-helix transcriptional regulator